MKKIVSLALSLVIIAALFSVIPIKAFATEDENRVQMGENIYGVYSDNRKTLTVLGSGEMWEGEKKNSLCWDEKSFCIVEDVENVILEEGITSISTYAFIETRVKEIIIPKSVTKIHPYAFSSSLEVLDLDMSTADISEGVKNCINLQRITVDDENPQYSVVDGVLFNKTLTKLCKYPSGKYGTAYTVPNTVTAIGSYAFYDNRLKNIDILAPITIIESYAFAEGNLEKVEFSNSLETINFYAFENCDNLTEVDFGKAKVIVETGAFADCDALKSVNLTRYIKAIKANAFEKSALRTVNIGKSELKDNISLAFADCNMLEKFTVSKTNKAYSAQSGVLYNKSKTKLLLYPQNKSVKTFKVPSTVKTIGRYAFSHSSAKLKTVNLPNRLKKINRYAFYDSNIKSLDIPSKVTYIGDFAFLGCSVIKVSLPKNIKRVRYGTFKNTDIENLIIPEGVRYIETGAFSSCDNLKTVRLPKSLKTIEKNAFSWSKVKTVNIGKCETKSSIKDAFNACFKLAKFKVSANNKRYSVKNGVLFNKKQTELIMYPENKNSRTYTIPSTVKVIGKESFRGNNKLVKIVIPKSVTTIENGAFRSADKLKKIVFKHTKHVPHFKEKSFAELNNTKLILKNEDMSHKLRESLEDLCITNVKIYYQS